MKDLFWCYILTTSFISIYGASRVGNIEVLTVASFMYIGYNVYIDKEFFEKDYYKTIMEWRK